MVCIDGVYVFLDCSSSSVKCKGTKDSNVVSPIISFTIKISVGKIKAAKLGNFVEYEFGCLNQFFLSTKQLFSAKGCLMEHQKLNISERTNVFHKP